MHTQRYNTPALRDVNCTNQLSLGVQFIADGIGLEIDYTVHFVRIKLSHSAEIRTPRLVKSLTDYSTTGSRLVQ